MGSRSSPAPAEITESGKYWQCAKKEKRSVDLTDTKTSLHRFDVRPIEAQKTLQTLNHWLAADIANGVADVSAPGWTRWRPGQQFGLRSARRLAKRRVRR